MGNTYTQLHFQTVFAVQNRISLINPKWEEDLYKYITGIIKDFDHKPLFINGMPDHLHVVFGMRPYQSLSNLMENIKSGSSKWINDQRLIKGKFRWQDGFGAFSYSKSQLPAVINYVKNQKRHHQKKTFLEEYVEMLEKAEVEFNPKYLFHDPYSLDK